MSFALRGALAVACLMPLGCAGADDPRVEEDSSQFDPAAGIGPIDALSRRFGRVSRRMSERGYDREVDAKRFFVGQEAPMVVPLDLPTATCTTFAAIAAGSIRDLRMGILDAHGREVAADAVRGQGALVHVCPQPSTEPAIPAVPVAESTTLPHYLVLRTVDGSGAVIAGAYRSSEDAGQGFEGLFEGLLAPEVPFRDVEDALAVSRSALRARGLTEVLGPEVEALAEGARLRVSVPLEVGRCYVAVAQTDPNVLDADLFLYDPGNAEVARELDEDRESRLQFCPEASGVYRYEAHAYEGSGAVGLMVLSEPAPDRQSPEPGEESPTLGEEPPLPAASDLLGEISRRLSGRGYRGPTPVVAGGTLTPGEVRVHHTALGAGCFVLVGATAGGGDLDLYLRDAAGQEVDRDTRIEPTARVRACPTERGRFQVVVKGYGRRNPYVLSLFEAPVGVASVRALRLEQASSPLLERDFMEVGRVSTTLSRGETYDRTVVIPRGECRAWAAAGETEVQDLDLFLRDESGQLLVSTAGPEPFASVSRCAEQEDETVTLRVLMYEGSGSAVLVALRGTGV